MQTHGQGRGIDALLCTMSLAVAFVIWWPASIACASESGRSGGQSDASQVQVAEVANDQITESSGLAASRANLGVLWTHNDSGDQPRLFALNQQGADLGIFHIPGIEAVDWEDLASVTVDGQHALLVADTGNNQRKRKILTLYLVAEPRVGRDRNARCLQMVRFRFEDGAHDCEAVAFSTSHRSVLLATKKIATSDIYELRWPKPVDRKVQLARKISTVEVPFVTGMDISHDGSRLIMGTYIMGFEFRRRPDESWRKAFSRRPTVVRMPPRLQGEAVCYGAEGTSLFLTSEKRPTPLFQLKRQR